MTHHLHGSKSLSMSLHNTLYGIPHKVASAASAQRLQRVTNPPRVGKKVSREQCQSTETLPRGNASSPKEDKPCGVDPAEDLTKRLIIGRNSELRLFVQTLMATELYIP